MPARRLLPLLALGLAAACGRGADSTGAATTTSTLPAGPGVHDHTPHHGGVVGMAGDLHLEALAAPDGRVRVYLTEFWRRPLPAASATGPVTPEPPRRQRAPPLAAVDLGVSAWRLPAGQLALAFAPPPPLVVPGPEGLQPHPESANDVAVRPDGSEAVVAREGRLLRYSTRTGRLARELAAPRGVLRSVAWSPDGATLLVTAFYDPSAHLVRAEDGRELRR